MTKEEFDNTGWTCGMTAEYNGHTYKIASCDFDERTVGLLCGGPGTEGDGITWVHCERVKVNPPNSRVRGDATPGAAYSAQRCWDSQKP